jgi:Flp pilus assembly pilin Flp
METATIKARLRRDEHGQGLAEYAIAIGVITLAVIVAVQLVGSNILTLWNQAASNIQAATG